MDKSKEKKKKYVCKFCNKEFPSGKSLGGHIRIHTNKVSVKSDSYVAKKNKRLVDQREEQQLCCRECGKGFVSLKALCAHMDIHSEIEKKKIVMDGNQSDETETETETSLSPTRKRSKNSESFTNVSLSSGSVIDQEDKDGALSLMLMFRESSSFKKGHNNSLAESSDNNSVIVETKSSSGEKLNNFNVLETDKDGVDDDDNGVSTCDSDGSDSDYFMNGPKKSDSDISVHGSLRNRLRNSDELRVKEEGSKYELMRKSKRVFTSHETDSCADTSSKIHHRSSDRKSTVVKKASGTKKYSDGHVCPYCFRVFKSGQALGGHKRSHSLGNQEHRGAEKRNLIDLNVPAQDIDE